MGEWERVRGRERVTRSVSRVDCPSLSGGPGGPGGRSHSESQSQFDRWTTTLTVLLPVLDCDRNLSFPFPGGSQIHPFSLSNGIWISRLCATRGFVPACPNSLVDSRIGLM